MSDLNPDNSLLELEKESDVPRDSLDVHNQQMFLCWKKRLSSCCQTTKNNVRQSINDMKLGVSDVNREGHKIMSTLVHGWSSSEIAFSWIPEKVLLWHLASPFRTIYIIKMKEGYIIFLFVLWNAQQTKKCNQQKQNHTREKMYL